MQIKFVLYGELYAEPVCKSEYTHPLQGRLSVPAKSKTRFDVIVIGSGAGGAPLAWSLAKKGYKVAVVESGGLAVPQGTAHALEHYYFKQGCTFALQGGLISSLAGNTVGGTTSINSGTCLRAHPSSLADWDQRLGTKFALGALESYFNLVEQRLGVCVPDRKLLATSADWVELGLARLGRQGSYVLPRCAPMCAGSGVCCFVCPTQAKRSTDLAFLPEALDHGCELFASTYAYKICEGRDSVQVQLKHNGQSTVMETDRLVLAAGAFSTPGLIRKNRLGLQWRMAGQHFRTHPASKVFAYFDQAFEAHHGVPQGLGYLTEELPRIVFEGVHTPRLAAAAMLQATGQTHRWWMQHYDHLATFGFMLVDGNEGRVRSFGSWPILQYRLSRDDVQQIVKALKLVSEIFFAAGARKVLWPLCGRETIFESMDEVQGLDLASFTSQHLLTSGFHPQGTAAMGVVVDQDLRLIGSDRIAVCDASVLPSSPRVNPQITIMALSLRLADRIF